MISEIPSSKELALFFYGEQHRARYAFTLSHLVRLLK
jgi:hypothetical protein